MMTTCFILWLKITLIYEVIHYVASKVAYAVLTPYEITKIKLGGYYTCKMYVVVTTVLALRCITAINICAILIYLVVNL